MKKWLIFGGGVLTGVVLTFIVLGIIAANRSNNGDSDIVQDNGTTWFEETGDIVDEESFQVFQVIGKDAALVHGKDEYGDLYIGTVYLLTNKENKYYYDDEIVEVPIGKVVRQVGVYQYPTKNGYKTVPIVEIMNK